MALGLFLAVLALQLMQGLAPPPVQAMTSAAVGDPTRYCYNWQAFNGAGQDVNGLHVRLQSLVQVSQIYTGTYNYFTPDEISGAYDANGDIYKLDFATETVGAGETVLIGLCSDHQTLALPASGTPFYWTANGVSQPIVPAFVGLDWGWRSRTELRLGLINSSSVTVTLLSLDVLDPGVKLALEDLTGDVIPALDPVSDLTSGSVISLTPGSTTYFTLQFDPNGTSYLPGHAPLLEPNHPYVLAATFAPWDDPDSTWTLISQALSPLAQSYLPLIRK